MSRAASTVPSSPPIGPLCVVGEAGARPPATERLEDALLARAVARGGREPCAELWDRFSPVVRRLVLRSLGSFPDQEDLVQEVFLNVYRKIHQLRDPAALRGFVVVVTTHAIRSELRKRRVRRFLGLRREDHFLEETPAPSADPHARLALSRLQRILDDLDTNLRLAFVLRYIEEMELTEVASGLEVSLATAKRYLAKARTRIWAKAATDSLLSTYLSIRREAHD